MSTRRLRIAGLVIGTIEVTVLATIPVAEPSPAATPVRPSAAAHRTTDPSGWGPEEPIAPGARPPYDGPAVVRTWSTGAAVAAWVAQGRRSPGLVTVGRRDRHGGWSAPTVLSAELRRGSGDVDLAVGPHGVASVVWGERTADDGWQIEESHLIAGSWSVADTLASSGPHARFPHPPRAHVAVDGRGTTTVVWSRGGIQVARRLAARTRWHHERVAAGGGDMLRLASNRAGEIVAAWLSGGRVVDAATSTPGGDWSPARELARGDVLDVQAAVDRAGRALVVWSVTGLWDEARHDYVDYAASSRSTSPGRWSSPAIVTDRLGEDGSTDSLSMRPSGTAILVWYQIYRTDSLFQIWTARFRPDGTWSTPARVGWCAEDAAAWIDPRGVAHEVTSCRSGVWSSTQSPGGTWRPRRRIGEGWLADVDGRGRHLTVVYVHRDDLLATALTVAR